MLEYLGEDIKQAFTHPAISDQFIFSPARNRVTDEEMARIVATFPFAVDQTARVWQAGRFSGVDFNTVAVRSGNKWYVASENWRLMNKFWTPVA